MNDTPSLQPSLEKIKRADENISNLDLETRIFIRDGLHEVIPDGKRDAYGRYIWNVDAVNDVPFRFAVLTGEIIHHLRSSLDLLVYQLIWKKSGKKPAFNCEFPILLNRPKSVKEYKSSFRGKVEGIAPRVRARLRKLQPYHPGRGVSSSLYLIHKLDIIDKHRLLVTMVNQVTVTEDIIKSGGVTLKVGGVYTALKPGAQIFTNLNQSEMDMESDLCFDVTFDEPELLQGKSVIPTLNDLRNFTVEILDSFSRDF